MERIELLFLSSLQGPELIAVQEGPEGIGSVHLDFGMFSQRVVSPYCLSDRTLL